jgi:hypothetical protein
MGWYLRKAFRFGPLRINLSKSGLGASFGVRGARVGVDAKGRPYAAGGRGGLYFRKRLPLAEGKSAPAPVPSLSPAPVPSSRSSALPWILLAIAVAIILALLVARS